MKKNLNSEALPPKEVFFPEDLESIEGSVILAEDKLVRIVLVEGSCTGHSLEEATKAALALFNTKIEIYTHIFIAEIIAPISGAEIFLSENRNAVEIVKNEQVIGRGFSLEEAIKFALGWRTQTFFYY